MSTKTVVITGASRGIGRETAKLLDAPGINLVLASRHIEGIEQGFNQSNVLSLPLDVCDESSVKRMVENSVKHFGNIDVLINAAGVGTFGSIIDSDTKDFDEMININLRGTYLTCKYVARHMVEMGKGQIINIASIASTTALPGCGGYSASKFGVLGLTKVLQAELRHKGIQITSVLPGSVNSSFWDDIDPKPDLTKMIPVNSIAQHIVFLLNQPEQCVVDEITIMPPGGIL